jgi:hypothetical protein
MADFDTNHLLKMLRQHTSLPAVAGWSDDDCLRLLTSVLHGYILPIVKAEWQEHNLSNDGTTYTVALTEGRREYPLPARAVAASIRKAVLVGPSGARRPLRLFEVDRQEEWNTSRQDLPEGYVLRGGRMYLHPAPSAVAASGWSLRVQMLVRPARLALPSACAQITSVAASGSGSLVTIAGNTAGVSNVTSLDLVRTSPPFEALYLEAAATWGSTTSATLPGVASSTLEVGTWLCPVGVAPFAQAPVELLEVLATRTAVEQLGTIGDTPVAEAKAATLGEQRKDATTVITPRTGEARLQGNGMRKFRGTAYGGSGWPY